ncbi:pyridoxal-phosphate dependent enzyme [Salinisphaera japonica]|uniref:cysteine synthase n=1 Tax=Salinisphaera japonica YTM-1 TaxID=1209778 RepID=A0A423PJ52_9GAMM|nr:pyridoxal-phosphate dependent enzyme [Salinisphaera japonica]ROO25615.1 pyridoxal-5'-phosphate-dependent protein [Salinisphaera japonica YTM-1]
MSVVTPLREITPGLLMKFECEQTGGSHKTRAARWMIRNGIKRGEIIPGETTILEKTGGNLGFGLGLAAAELGCEVNVVIGLSFSPLKREAIKYFGAQSVGEDLLHDGLQPKAVIQHLLDNQQADGKRYYYVDQLNNRDGLEAHEYELGPEIARQIDDLHECKNVVFVTSAGTGAHLTGISRALRRAGYGVRVVLVEPEGCDSRQNIFAEHSLEGISVGVVPPLIDWSLVEEHTTVSEARMLQTRRAFMASHGYLIGNTSAACLAAAETVRNEIGPDQNWLVLTIAYDSGLWYEL